MGWVVWVCVGWVLPLYFTTLRLKSATGAVPPWPAYVGALGALPRFGRQQKKHPTKMGCLVVAATGFEPVTLRV